MSILEKLPYTTKVWLRNALPIIYRKSPWIIMGTIILLMVFVLVRWDDFESSQPIQETNNAYVHYDVTAVEAKVSGYIREVAFSDFQEVRAGDVLVTLVDDDFRMAVLQAEAKRDHAVAGLANLALEEKLQEANVEQAKAAALSTAAKLDLAQREYNRLNRLVRQGAVAKHEFDTAETNLTAVQANHQESTALILVQQRKLELLSGDSALREADVKSAQAGLENARIDLGHTRITVPSAPVSKGDQADTRSSRTGTCKVRTGELVKIGTQIASLVPGEPPHIIANYKETQLTNIHIGQKVELRVDTFPGQPLQGYVAGISPATGATYSLIPTDNSSGNFTKVVQRIPVRIELEQGQPLLQRLRAGMSVTTRIDTRE